MEIKVKLVAIAKDEAAYLPDWIFHHLYFGFDEIDIYVNNTTDNTNDLKFSLHKENRVNFIDGNSFFNNLVNKPQEKIYRHAMDLAKREGFTHLLFLDVDEFWTPKDFNSDIKNCLNSIKSDVICFEWFILQSELAEFSEPYNIENEGILSPFVKSILCLNRDYENVGVHNSISSSASYVLVDGTPALFEGKGKGKIASEYKSKELKQYFIQHRMFRSQMEYVSLLAQPLAINPSNAISTFKSNRPGYCPITSNVRYYLPEEKLEKYAFYKNEFMSKYLCEEYFSKARDFVKNRFISVNKNISNAASFESFTLNKILKNVTISPTKEVFSSWKEKNITPGDVEILRDLAISFESSDLFKAYKLMSIAQKMRPNGTVILNKIKQYKQELKI